MAEVFFSVVISAYNAEKYIFTALASIKAQTESDYELIVVDDGSLDQTADIVENFMSENPSMNMKIIKLNENQGISGGRNTGIENSTGKYICFLDADDYWYPDKLRIMKQAVRKHRDNDVFWHWEDHIKSDSKKLVRYRPVDNSRAYMDLLYHDNCLSTSAVVVKADRVKSIGGFDTRLRSGEEDYDCWLRLAKNGARFFLVRKALGAYRISGDGISSKFIGHYQGIIHMLYGHYMNLMKSGDRPRGIMRKWRRKKAQYLCGCARQLAVAGNRKDAFWVYGYAAKCDIAYMKTYAGMILSVFNI